MPDSAACRSSRPGMPPLFCPLTVSTPAAIIGAPVDAVLLSAESIAKSFAGARALDGVSFDVRAGEVHALVGENGAGKSTLIKIMTGAEAPDRGTITIGGRVLVAARSRGRARPRHRRGLSAAGALSSPDRDREPRDRQRGGRSVAANRLAGAPRSRASSAGEDRRVARSRSHGRHADDARAADGGDCAGARRRCARADPRRADRVADHPRGRCAARSGPAAARAGCWHRLHFTSARRGAGNRRSDYGAARRPNRRYRGWRDRCRLPTCRAHGWR